MNNPEINRDEFILALGELHSALEHRRNNNYTLLFPEDAFEQVGELMRVLTGTDEDIYDHLESFHNIIENANHIRPTDVCDSADSLRWVREPLWKIRNQLDVDTPLSQDLEQIVKWLERREKAIYDYLELQF